MGMSQLRPHSCGRCRSGNLPHLQASEGLLRDQGGKLLILIAKLYCRRKSSHPFIWVAAFLRRLYPSGKDGSAKRAAGFPYIQPGGTMSADQSGLHHEKSGKSPGFSAILVQRLSHTVKTTLSYKGSRILCSIWARLFFRHPVDAQMTLTLCLPPIFRQAGPYLCR